MRDCRAREAADDVGMTATIALLEQLGATSFLYCTLPGGQKLTVQIAGQVARRPGDTHDVYFSADDAHLFTKDPGETALARLRRTESVSG